MPPGNRLTPMSQNAFGAPPTLAEIQLAARTAQRPAPLTLGERAQELNYGLGRGFTNILEGNLGLAQALYQDPRAVGSALANAARQFAANPVDTVGNSLRGMWNRAKSSPAGLGEVVGENINPLNLLKPKKAIMANMAENSGPYSPGDMPKIIRDNPGGDWLTQKRKYAEAQGTKPSGAFKYPGELTASYNDTVYLPVSVLEKIPGENMEQFNVRQNSLDWLTKEMSEKKRLPTYEASGKEYDNAPFITVDSRGRPFVTEGNHRIMVAKQLGWQYLPVEIRYFNGGELEDGLLNPKQLEKFTKQAKP
jgi:hypothetical protein